MANLNQMSLVEAYNTVALYGDSLLNRLERGLNGKFKFLLDIGAVKYLLKLTKDGENEELLNQELRLLRILNEAGAQVPMLHPEYIDNSWGECYGIGMALLDNAATLGDYAEAYVASQIPLSVFEQILEASRQAIESVHEAGVLHNDLHANNIVLTLEKEGFKGYVIDFGWSHLVEDGELPEWIEKERMDWAEDPSWDILFLMEDLGKRMPKGTPGEKEYIGALEILNRN